MNYRDESIERGGQFLDANPAEAVPLPLRAMDINGEAHPARAQSGYRRAAYLRLPCPGAAARAVAAKANAGDGSRLARYRQDSLRAWCRLCRGEWGRLPEVARGPRTQGAVRGWRDVRRCDTGASTGHRRLA